MSFLLAYTPVVEYDVLMQILAYLGSPSQWFILAVVCLVIFGSRRLPDLARNLGKSLGALKKARREFEEELLKAQDSQPAAKLTQSAEPESRRSEEAPKQD